MPRDLRRYYGFDHLHFVTFSCYRRQPFLAQPRSRDLFLQTLEQVRQRYCFVVAGYVVMPEHIHLLIGEPKTGNPSVVLQVLKQRSARKLLPRRKRNQARLWEDADDSIHFWQKRFYDFNVFTQAKLAEKLRYMHRNPVKRGLVESPELWRWSSYRWYALQEMGAVHLNAGWEEPTLRAG